LRDRILGKIAALLAEPATFKSVCTPEAINAAL
jgi:hypothetical protein